PPRSTLFPYTTLFRSRVVRSLRAELEVRRQVDELLPLRERRTQRVRVVEKRPHRSRVDHTGEEKRAEVFVFHLLPELPQEAHVESDLESASVELVRRIVFVDVEVEHFGKHPVK